MHHTRRRFLPQFAALATLALPFTVFAEPPGRVGDWFLDFRAAQRESMRTARPVLAFFTDTRGNPECRDLERDILTAPAFTQWARNRVVLLRVDLPRNLLTEPDLRRQNERLQLRYQPHGVDEPPVLLLLNNIGNLIGDGPFAPKETRDPVAFTRELEAFIEQRGDEEVDAPDPDEEK
jgi:Thioredoxin-like